MVDTEPEVISLESPIKKGSIDAEQVSEVVQVKEAEEGESTKSWVWSFFTREINGTTSNAKLRGNQVFKDDISSKCSVPKCCWVATHNSTSNLSKHLYEVYRITKGNSDPDPTQAA